MGCYADQYNIPPEVSKVIGRTSHARWTLVKNMSINHRRLQIFMAEKLLNSSDVISFVARWVRKELISGSAISDG